MWTISYYKNNSSRLGLLLHARQGTGTHRGRMRLKLRVIITSGHFYINNSVSSRFLFGDFGSHQNNDQMSNIEFGIL